MQRGSILLLALALSSLLVVCFAETEALPQGCATGGTKITLRAGGASLSLDSASNFKVQPVVGVDKLVIDASRGALPVFKGDVSFGPATSNCLGLLAVNNGDLQAYIRPSLLGAAAWTSLSLSSPIATDATTDTTIQNELYQVSTCGRPLEPAGRQSACTLLSTANELAGLTELQALTATNAAQPFADPTLALGASSISNSISKTIALSFGTVYASAAAGLQNSRRTIVFRTQGSTADDYAFRNQFNTYAVPSFDPISGAVYNTYDINGAVVTPFGREFWLSNYGFQDNLADASDPSALLLHYNCPQAVTETQRTCSTVALITGGDTGNTLGFSTDQPAPLAQTLPITPANFAPGANYIIRHPQLAIDSKGLIHIFFFTSAPAALDQLYYMFCKPVHGNQRADFTLSTSNCVVTKLLDTPAVTAKSNLRLQARHFNGTETTGPSIVVSAYTREYRRDRIQAATPTTSAVSLFTFKPTDDQSSAWTYTSTVFPPQQSPVAGASPSSQFVFPNNGRLYDFDLAITDNDSTATKVAITYSYTRYVNNYSNKRATPGNPDFSREEYVFRTILCPEFRCLSFTTRQLVGSRSFFHTHYGTVPRGISGIISSQYNAGRPAFAFAVGSGDRTSAVRAGAVPLLTGSDVAGGPIGILNCIDDLCSSASLQRTSDYLAGHRGSFAFTPTPLGVLVASIPVVALRPSPVFQSFRNPFSSPTAAHCTATEAGKQRSIDGEVFVCTALPDSPILDATAIFYWAPIATSIQSLVGVAPTSISNPGAGLQAALPTC